MCDSIDYVVGAVLWQRRAKKICAIYYARRTLDEVQINYATMEKERLAVFFCNWQVSFLPGKFGDNCLHWSLSICLERKMLNPD